MLRKLRIIFAAIFFSLITLLFLDFTGTIHAWAGWMAKIQFLPAVLALNAGVVVGLVILTLLFGRIYCSVICPLGVMQDIFSWGGGRHKKNRFKFRPAKPVIRWTIFVIFCLTLALGFGSLALIIAPYSAYGRIAQNILAPIWQWGNNLLAYFAERADSYAFYSTDVWIRGLGTFVIAAITLLTLAVWSWYRGRQYCNTVCPVGTILGVLSRFSLLKPVINREKCINCNLCARNCKSSCIDVKRHAIDYSRCVVCMDCIDVCNKGAISYTWRRKATQTADTQGYASQPQTEQNKAEQGKGSEGISRSTFIATAGILTASAVKAQEMKLDGGYATLADKIAPPRRNAIVPAGSLSARNMAARCTGCQLCVAVCPSQVLRPSASLTNFMQPHLSFEKGYCRPECNKCSEVCPAGAIKPISVVEKSSTQIGHAVWVKKNCVVVTDDVDCDNCQRHCPSAAITMVALDPKDEKLRKIPAINTSLCIGCGACEALCPARPFSAIYVEGHLSHKTI